MRNYATFTTREYELTLEHEQGKKWYVMLANNETGSKTCVSHHLMSLNARLSFIVKATKLFEVHPKHVMEQFGAVPVVESLVALIPAYKDDEIFKDMLKFAITEKSWMELRWRVQDDNTYLNQKGLEIYEHMQKHVGLEKYKDITLRQYNESEQIINDYEEELRNFKTVAICEDVNFGIFRYY